MFQSVFQIIPPIQRTASYIDEWNIPVPEALIYPQCVEYFRISGFRYKTHILRIHTIRRLL